MLYRNIRFKIKQQSKLSHNSKKFISSFINKSFLFVFSDFQKIDPECKSGRKCRNFIAKRENIFHPERDDPLCWKFIKIHQLLQRQNLFPYKSRGWPTTAYPYRIHSTVILQYMEYYLSIGFGSEYENDDARRPCHGHDDALEENAHDNRSRVHDKRKSCDGRNRNYYKL